MKLLTLAMIVTFGALHMFLSDHSRAVAEEVIGIAPAEVVQLVYDKEAIIVDVRESDEWLAGHIPDAKHIPLDQLKARLGELEEYKDGPIIMQCHSGGRSAIAARMLKEADFPHVYYMDGGIVAWDKAAFPTE